jgi:hypothetical protein
MRYDRQGTITREVGFWYDDDVCFSTGVQEGGQLLLEAAATIPQ